MISAARRSWGVHKAEEEHHRDRAHAELLQPLDAATNRFFVERFHHLALEVHPLRDRDAGAAARDGIRRRIGGVPDLFLVDAAHLDLVAVTLGHQQARRRAVHLDHGVVGGRGAVHEDVEITAEVGDRGPEPFGKLRKAVHHADRLVVGRGRGLVEHDVAVGRHTDQIGERPADVDADPVAHPRRPTRVRDGVCAALRSQPRRQRASGLRVSR
jgi:hypothetical protein